MDMRETGTGSVWNATVPLFNQPPTPAKLISEELSYWIENILSFLMVSVILVAIATNAINIRVFLKQGIKSDSTTLSLFSLSVSDLLGAVALLPTCACFILRLFEGRWVFISCNTVTLLTTAVVHNICFAISSWVTVYMSLERSLSVVMPLKVRLIFTPMTTAIAIFTICVVLIAANVSVISTFKIVWKRHPMLNVIFAIPYKSPLAEKMTSVSNIILLTILNSVALFIVIITTSLMLYKLNQSRKWRKGTVTKVDNDKTTTGSQDNGGKRQSSKEIEIVKTVTAVTSIFLVCLSVVHIPSAFIHALPSLTHTGVNQNFMSMVFTIKYFFDAINESVNFFFYVRVSSRYKATFYSLFPGCSKE